MRKVREEFLVNGDGTKLTTLKFIPDKKKQINPFISLMKDCKIELIKPKVQRLLTYDIGLVCKVKYMTEYPCTFIGVSLVKNPTRGCEIKKIEPKSLSDKIIGSLMFNGTAVSPRSCNVEDIKEAVQKVKQLIKEELVNFSFDNKINPIIAGRFSGELRNKINKILGDKLI